MKKLFALLLVVITISTAVCAMNVNATETKLTNIAKGCKYSYTPEPYTQPNANKYVEVDGKELTDGIKTGGTGDTCWVAWNSGSTITVTLDLGSVKSGIVRLSSHFEKETGWGIRYPGAVTYSISSDGKTYKKLEKLNVSAETKEADVKYTDKNGFSARYVKVEIDRLGGFVFCSEIEVFTGTIGDNDDGNDVYDGSDIGLPDSDFNNPYDKTAVKAGSKPDYNSVRTMYNSGEYTVKTSSGQKLICGVKANLSVSDFKQTLGHTDCTVWTAAGKQKTIGTVVTGDVVKLGSDKATVVLAGDVNSDGKITADDAAEIKKAVLGIGNQTDTAKAAADINNDGDIDILDYIVVKREANGQNSIALILDDSHRRETYPMSVKKVSDSQVTITCDTDIGKLEIALNKSSWGMFNLGAWSLDGTRIAAGSTDWEYVYRAGTTAGSTPFSGGNHGSEDLKSIEYYDIATGKKLNLTNGVSVGANGVKVVEKSVIRVSDTQYQYLAVTRTYYFVGTKITLECDCEVLNDVYFTYSYTCMFAVPKTQGRFCTFHKTDGTDKKYTSLTVGYGDYSGPFYGRTNASSATITGYTGAKVKFDVSVYGEDAHQNFDTSLKTQFWDMNTGENKLYFSIFDTTATQIKKGVKWSTKAVWQVSADTDRK